MKKENFVTMLLSIIGGIPFALGMCMCLLPEWNAFTQGVIFAAVGAVILLIAVAVRRKMKGKAPIKVSGKAVGITALGVLGALTLGLGMCMTMVWEGMLILGVVVGLVGIIILLCLIPLCIGLK